MLYLGRTNHSFHTEAMLYATCRICCCSVTTPPAHVSHLMLILWPDSVNCRPLNLIHAGPVVIRLMCRRMSSAVNLLLSTFCRQPSAVNLLPSTFCRQPSAVNLLPSTFCRQPLLSWIQRRTRISVGLHKHSHLLILVPPRWSGEVNQKADATLRYAASG